MPQQYSEELERFYTDNEHPRQMFEQMIAAERMPHRLFVVHGVGGIGKSSLLRMLRLQALRRGIAASLASGDIAREPGDLMAQWSADFARNGIDLQPYTNESARLLELRAKADAHAQRTDGPRTSRRRRFSSRAMESATGAAAGALVGSFVPGAGSVVGAVGGAAAEATLDWLRSFMDRDDADFAYDPENRLTGAFMEAMIRLARHGRVVLLADALERMLHLQPWLGRVAEYLPTDVLLVVAGRDQPRWEQQPWHAPGTAPWAWRTEASFHEIAPMDEDDVRNLIRRYYEVQLGSHPDEHAVERIVSFASGLPIAVTTAVDIWARFSVTDFDAVEGKALSQLAGYLLNDIPSELRDLVAAAAAVRFFNLDLIAAMVDKPVDGPMFNALTEFPFVRPGSIGSERIYRVHDLLRDAIERDLYTNYRRIDRRFHHRAAESIEMAYLDIDQSPLDEAWMSIQAERAFQLLQAHDRAALPALHSVYTSALRYLRYDVCRSILDDLESLHRTDPVLEHRLAYYRTRLTVAVNSSGYLDDATMKALVDEAAIDTATQWEVYAAYADYLSFTARPQEAAQYLERSLKALTDAGLRRTSGGCHVLTTLAVQHQWFFGEAGLVTAEELLEEAVSVSSEVADPYAEYLALVGLAHVRFSLGDRQEPLGLWQRALGLARDTANNDRIADALNRYAQGLIAVERFEEAEAVIHEAFSAAEQLPDTAGGRRDKEMYIRRHLGLLRIETGDYGGAVDVLRTSAETYRERKSINGLYRTLVVLAEAMYMNGSSAELEELAPEIDALTAKTALGDWRARWKCLLGHKALDVHEQVVPAADQAIEAYADALETVLPISTIALDAIARRVLWRLGALPEEGGRQAAATVIAKLRESWNGSGDGASSADRHREALAVSTARTNDREADFLLDERTATEVLSLRHKPHSWEFL